MTQLADDCFAFGGRLMPMAEALDILAARIHPIAEVEETALADAAGRTLAEDVISSLDVPPHDNAAVDGYAFAAASLRPGAETALRIAGRAAAGHPLGRALEPGEAARIFTGGAMPGEADTVAMQEDVRLDGRGNVLVPPGLKPGANRRRAGEDVRRGAPVLRRGQRLRPQDLGLAAAIGRPRLAVYRRLRIAIFSTGDELREPGTPLPAGTIYDANRYMLASLLSALGCRVSDLGILADDAATMRRALAGAAARHDVLVTSGGVSTGEEDHVRAAVEAQGNIHFWRLAIKPGRPIALGQVAGTAFIGLPGNPVAAMVCFLRFARPLVLRLGGARDVVPLLYRVRADFEHTKKPDRREWVRARLMPAADGGLAARKFERQGSGILSSMVETDGLVEIGEEVTHLERGAMVDFLPFNEVCW